MDDMQAGRFSYFGRTMPRAGDALWQRIVRSGSLLSFSAGSVIYLQNAATDGMFFVEKGTVRVFQQMADGTDVTTEYFTERQLFGEASAFSGDFSSPMAMAQTDVTLRFLSKSQAMDMIETDSEFAVLVIAGLTHKLRTATDQMASVAGSRVSDRLTDALLNLENYGVSRDAEGWYSISHESLASLISTTRANTTVQLNRLAQEGLIAMRRKGIKILSPEGLSAFQE